MTDGSGSRSITRAESWGSGSNQLTSTASVSMDGIDLLGANDDWIPPVTQKQVLLLADSMGRCIPLTDSVFQVVAKDGYSWAAMRRDVIQGKLNLSHKHIIVWCGAQEIQYASVDRMMGEVKQLVLTLMEKQPSFHLGLSAMLPQPKHQHHLQDKINDFNSSLQLLAEQLQVKYLAAELVYLDSNGDIV